MGILKDYFSFSKRERTGAIVLIILIVVIFLLPEFYPVSKGYADQKEIAEFKQQASQFKALHSDSTEAVEITSSSNYEKPYSDDSRKSVLFYFDPNTVSEDGWRKLGIPERTIATIQKYISKGGSFKKPEDLGKIYGLRKDKFEQLLPFVRIVARNEPHKKEQLHDKLQDDNRPVNRTPVTIDLNEADSSMLIALPGIGSKLANRILNFRDKLGGFHSPRQVSEVYGLPDSTFQKIKTYLKCDSSEVRRLNINTCEEAVLKNHPYIKWNIARAIINYRQQHGAYDRLDKLLEIDILSPEVFEKISPYLKVE